MTDFVEIGTKDELTDGNMKMAICEVKLAMVPGAGHNGSF